MGDVIDNAITSWRCKFHMRNSNKIGKEKRKKYFSIRKKLIAYFIAFSVIPVAVVSIVYTQVSSNVVRKNSENLSLEMVKQTAVNANYFINQVETAITNVGNNLTMTSGLVTNYFSEDENTRYEAKLSIDQQLAAIPTTDKNIKKLSMILSEEDVFGSKLNNDLKEIMNHPIISSSYDYVWKAKSIDKPEVFTVMKRIPYISTNKDLVDVVVILVAEVNIKSIFTNIGDIQLLDNANLTLLAENSSVLFSTDTEMAQMREDITLLIPQLAGVKQTVGVEQESETIVTDSDPTIDVDNHINTDTEELEDRLSGTGRTDDNTLVYYASLSNGWVIIMDLPENTLAKDLTDSLGIIIGLIVLFILIAIIAGNIVAKNYSNPIIKLMKLMKLAEEGDLTISSEIRGNDETTQLCISFNHMLSNINRQFSETKAVIISTLTDTEVLRRSAVLSNETMEQLNRSINEISAGTVQQSEDNQESIQVMTSLSESIQEVVRKVMNISESSHEVQSALDKANEEMVTLTDSTKASSQITNNVYLSMEQLSELTKSISKIMNLIDGISEETNLLALNAAIEAARAGDAGRGFAVVAQQIRKLSEQTKSSTANVKDVLTKIDRKTQDTVELFYKSNKIYESQNGSMDNTKKAFDLIFDALNVVNSDLEEINGHTNQMSELKLEMAMKIENIAAITEETAASSQEVNALSENQKDTSEKLYLLSDELSSKMATLKASMEKFRV